MNALVKLFITIIMPLSILQGMENSKSNAHTILRKFAIRNSIPCKTSLLPTKNTVDTKKKKRAHSRKKSLPDSLLNEPKNSFQSENSAQKFDLENFYEDALKIYHTIDDRRLEYHDKKKLAEALKAAEKNQNNEEIIKKFHALAKLLAQNHPKIIINWDECPENDDESTSSSSYLETLDPATKTAILAALNSDPLVDAEIQDKETKILQYPSKSDSDDDLEWVSSTER
ncbi:MAG: hypothetical protein WD068_03645 [Candidatus Babeliales bacterium]